jgi:anti-sigma regulatory factor (Ser/Thr protein kinase)
MRLHFPAAGKYPGQVERSRSFDARPGSVRAARRFVVSVVRETEVDADVAELLTSELATNAVVHAGSAFEVRVRTADSTVRVEIVNDEPELLASLREPDERGGRGLAIIESLAARWGTESDRGHKIVWFELVTPRAVPRSSVGLA